MLRLSWANVHKEIIAFDMILSINIRREKETFEFSTESGAGIALRKRIA